MLEEISNHNKTEISSGTIVAPGDWLGVIEEFIPSNGTYEEKDGSIYASTGGKVVIDEHRIAVQTDREMVLPVRGVKAIGLVSTVKKQVASVDIFKIGTRILNIPITALLHISNSSHSYVRSMYDVCRPGDWVYSVIIKSGVPVHVSLVGSEFGVLKGLCNYCGHALIRFKTSLLKCSTCEEIQPRVVSHDFGKIM